MQLCPPLTCPGLAPSMLIMNTHTAAMLPAYPCLGQGSASQGTRRVILSPELKYERYHRWPPPLTFIHACHHCRFHNSVVPHPMRLCRSLPQVAPWCSTSAPTRRTGCQSQKHTAYSCRSARLWTTAIEGMAIGGIHLIALLCSR